MSKNGSINADIVRQILRMSQKALACTLALIGVGYIGGLIAICASPGLSEPLQAYAEIFTPVWQLEIGMYGIGSTLENLQKMKAQLSNINQNVDTTENG